MTLEPKKRRGAPPPTGREDRKQSGTLCTATRRDGQPCTNFARLGASVCRMHGGSAPQVIRAAQVRLLMASDRLMAQLLLIAEDKAEPTPVRLVAIRDALDRAGLGAKQQIELTADVTTQSWEHKVDAAIVDWGELASFADRDLSEIAGPGYAPEDATEYAFDRPDEHRERRMAEIEATVGPQVKPDPTEGDGLPAWVAPETGAETARRLADEHKKAAFRADRAGGGLVPKTRRKR